MALDPRISLAAQAPQIQQPDLLRTMLVSAQLQEQAKQNQLRDMQLVNMVREQQQQAGLDEAIRRHYGPQPPGMETPGQGGEITQTPLGQPAMQQAGPTMLPGQQSRLGVPNLAQFG